MTTTMIMLIAIVLVGWVAAAVIGTQTYFRGEQSKPIHNRNLNSQGFEAIASIVTGQPTDYSNRIPAYSLDAFTSKNLAE